MLFSKRLRVSEEAEQWCYSNDVKVCALNIVTALDALGYLREVAAQQLAEADRAAWSDARHVCVLLAASAMGRFDEQELGDKGDMYADAVELARKVIAGGAA